MNLDPRFFLLLLPALAGIIGQGVVRREFARWNEVQASIGLNGAQVAKRLLELFGMNDVAIERAEGKLSDHFDPDARILRLSADVAEGQTIASVAISAHEAAHAQQHGSGGVLFRIRSRVGRSVARLSQASGFIFIGAFVFGNPVLMMAAGGLILGMALFALVTLPVELQASRSAIQTLETNSMVTADELPGVRRVLRAAAFTYVANLGQRLGLVLFLVVGALVAVG